MMAGQEDGSIDASNSMSELKKRGTGSRNWMLMDSLGQQIMLDIDKHAIMHRFKIPGRDVRILDPLLSYPSTILGREGAIILNLEHIKAIITANEVLLGDPLDDDVVPIVECLRDRLKPQNMNEKDINEDDTLDLLHDIQAADEAQDHYPPFEFRALEVALQSICAHLSANSEDLENAIYPSLDMLTSKINSDNLDRVRRLKSQMKRLTTRVQKVRDELEQLLDDNDDMAELYLSRKTSVASSPVAASTLQFSLHSEVSKTPRASVTTFRGYQNDVDQIEMLLEAYFIQIDGTLSKLNMLREYIESTEDFINIQLDNHRNQLIQLELFLRTGSLSLTICSLVAGVFGVNIPYTWNNGYGYMYKWVLIVTGTFAAAVFICIIGYARRRGLIEF